MRYFAEAGTGSGVKGDKGTDIFVRKAGDEDRQSCSREGHARKWRSHEEP